jgi:predicted 3-demethylubiquinone-9 3-methyltransferase (glyoxalase superfamily)
MPKITPFLWFDDKAEEAANFYVSIFKNSKVKSVTRYGDAGPGPNRCGWLADKYCLSWQIVPTVLSRLLGDKDPAKSQRVMQAMLQMDKMDIEELEDVYAG